MPQDLSGGSYRFALLRTCLPALPQFLLGFCLVFGNPLRNFFPLAIATNHCRKIKNPASSAGRNHPHLGGSTRCSTSFYPVLVKNPTIGSTSRLRFFPGRLLRSDCDAPEQSSALQSPRTTRNNTSFSCFVKPFKTIISAGFPQPVDSPVPGPCASTFPPLTYRPGASHDTLPEQP